MYKLKIAFALTLLTAIGVMIAKSKTPETETQSRIETESREPASRGKPQPTSLLYSPQAGTQYVYSYSRKIDFYGAEPAMDSVVYHGDLVVQVTSVKPTGFEAIIQNRMIENPDHSQTLLKMSVSKNGEEISLFQSKELKTDESQSISLMKDLISLLLFYSREDTTGKYEAEFNHLRKSKLTYLTNTSPTPKILNSQHELTWDESTRMPKQIHGEDLTQFNDLPIQILASFEMTLSQVSSVTLPPSTIASLSHQISLTLTLDTDEGMVQSASLSKSLDWNGITEKLNQLDHSNSQQQLRIFGELVKSLKSGKTSVSALKEFIKSKGALKEGEKSVLFKTATGALATLGTPEAQSTLLEIYDDQETPHSGRGVILSALTTMPAPQTPETQTHLMETVKNETNSYLAQGAAFAVSSTPSTPVITFIRDMKQEQLDTAIDMMGNSGSEKFLPDLVQIITHNEFSSTRAKAVYALRSIPGTEAAAILSQTLSDKDAQVRESTIEVILSKQWNDQYATAIQNCIHSETNAYIRSQCNKAKPQS